VSDHLTQILKVERFIAEVFLVFSSFKENFLQDQLRAATQSVQNMQRLHEYGQSQLFELHAYSGMFLKWVFCDLPLSCWLHCI
jgi:hypothetical protein